MLHKLESPRVKHQGIPGNACFRLICLGETSVNHQKLASGFHRVLPFPDFYGDMPVDYMRAIGRQSEFRQNGVAHLGIVT